MAERWEALPVVGVMGSGTDEHDELAAPLGRVLAEAGVHLLTGGGRGVMEAVSRAFRGVGTRAGLVIGVCPGRIEKGAYRAPSGYPNPWVEVAIRTHLPDSGVQGRASTSRNHINVLSSDLVIALPGGAGTASEIALAVRYGRPVYSLGRDGRDPPEVHALGGAGEVTEVLRSRFGAGTRREARATPGGSGGRAP